MLWDISTWYVRGTHDKLCIDVSQWNVCNLDFGGPKLATTKWWVVDPTLVNNLSSYMVKTISIACS